MKWLLVTVALYMQPGENPTIQGVMIENTTKEACIAGEYFNSYQKGSVLVTEIASCIQQGEA